MKNNKPFAKLLTFKNYLFFGIVNGITVLICLLYIINSSWILLWNLVYAVLLVLLFVIGIIVNIFFATRKKVSNFGLISVLSSVTAIGLLFLFSFLSAPIDSAKSKSLIESRNSSYVLANIKALEDFKSKNGLYPESLDKLDLIFKKDLPYGVSLSYVASSNGADDYSLKLSRPYGYLIFSGCGSGEKVVIRNSKKVDKDSLNSFSFQTGNKAIDDYWFIRNSFDCLY